MRMKESCDGSFINYSTIDTMNVGFLFQKENIVLAIALLQMPLFHFAMRSQNFTEIGVKRTINSIMTILIALIIDYDSFYLNNFGTHYLELFLG